MKILASSLAEVMGEVLHPGYGHSPTWKPTPLPPEMLPVTAEPTLALDLDVALALAAPPATAAISAPSGAPSREDEAAAVVPRVDSGQPPPEGLVSRVAAELDVVAASVAAPLAVTLALVGLLLLPRRARPRALARSTLGALAIGLGCTVGLLRAEPAKPDAATVPAPASVAAPASAAASAASAASAATAAGATPRFAHPREATLAILYGLLWDGLVTTPLPKDERRGHRPFRGFDELRGELAFPVAPLTSGMAFALSRPELDGWGRPFVFAAKGSSDYTVTSVGEDGLPGTGDDLVLAVDKPFDPSWARHRQALFLRRQGDATLVFYHRHAFGESWWRMGYHHRALARELTATELFDVIEERQLYPVSRRTALRARFDGHAAAPSATVLVFYPRRAMIGNGTLGLDFSHVHSEPWPGF